MKDKTKDIINSIFTKTMFSISLLILIFLFCLNLCPMVLVGAFHLVGSGIRGSGGSAEDTPNVLGLRCEDNAASTTATAWVGSNGVYYNHYLTAINSNTVTSTDHYQGTRSFLPNAEAGKYEYIKTANIADDNFDDGTFTVQFAFKASTAITGAVKFIYFYNAADGSPVFYIGANSSDTSMVIYWGGDWNNITVNDMTTGSWQVFRIVINTGATNKITVYQGASEAELTSVGVDTTSAAVAFPDNFYAHIGGGDHDTAYSIASVGGLIDDIKIWDTAETP